MKNFILLLFCTGISLSSPAQNIVQVEYFIDTDLGVGNNTLVNVNPSTDSSYSLNINLASYLPGYHKLYIRTKDSNGNWSLTARRNVEVFAPYTKTTVIRGEYFIDIDPGFGMASPVTVSAPDSMILQNFSAVISGQTEGYHKLYGRFLDNEGRWSLTFRRNMEVYKNDTTKVTGAEYFFKTDLGFGNCTPVKFSNAASDGSFTFNIPLNTIPANADTLFVRVQNGTEFRWSLTQTLTGFSGALPLTLLNFQVTQENAVAKLAWQTSDEVNTAYFNVERSIDATHFNAVGKVDATNINTVINNYNYADNITGITAPVIYYRLQMIDIDGNFQYSKIIPLTISEANTGIQIFPNPAADYITISTNNPQDLGGAVLKIVDMAGRIALQQSLTADISQQINIGALANGIYILHINKHSGSETYKLIKQ